MRAAHACGRRSRRGGSRVRARKAAREHVGRRHPVTFARRTEVAGAVFGRSSGSSGLLAPGPPQDVRATLPATANFQRKLLRLRQQDCTIVGVTVRRIVPLGGGGFSVEPRNPRLDKWLLSLTRRRRPRVLFLATASGDSPRYVQRFYRAFSKHSCEAAHLSLFDRSGRDVRKTIVSSDLIYVGGGNTANLLAIWRVHGVDDALREAWQDGSVLCGVSAGAICWFEAGLTDSFGPDLQALRGALGILRGSFCPHYNTAPRRPAYHRLIAGRELPQGYAADDGVAILFEDSAIEDVVRSRRGVAAYRVTRRMSAAVEETLEARLLPP